MGRLQHPTVDYTNILKNDSFSQLINKSTRVTNLSQSIIDDIIANDDDHKSHIAPAATEYENLSDHYPVFVSVDKSKNCNTTFEI